MTHHGAGSSTSPIVISDDEDEEFVDRQLRVEATSESPTQGLHQDTSASPTAHVGPESSRKRWARNRHGQLIKTTERRISANIQASPIVSDPSISAGPSFSIKRKHDDSPLLNPVDLPPVKKPKKKNKKKSADVSSSHRPDVQPPIQPFPSSAPYNHYEQPVPALQQWPRAAFNPYEGSQEFDSYADIPAYLHQEAAMRAQIQLQFESMMYQGAYFPPMYPAMYHPPPHMQMQMQQMNPHPYGAHESALNDSDMQYPLEGHGIPSAHDDHDEQFLQVPPPDDSPAMEDISMPESTSASAWSKPHGFVTPPEDKDVLTSHDVSRSSSALDGIPELPVPSGSATSASRPPPKSVLSIGIPEATGTHGVFSITKELDKKCPKFRPGCALVMEAIPRAFRNDQFIRSWAKRAAGIVPCYHRMNDKGRVLLVFQSPELAKQAFDSPRLPHGEGKEGIRVWWHREPDVTAEKGNALPHEQDEGMSEMYSPPRQLSRQPEEDLEDGEIEDIIVDQPTSVKSRSYTDKPQLYPAIDTLNKPRFDRLPNKPKSQFNDRQSTSQPSTSTSALADYAPVTRAYDRPPSSSSRSDSVGALGTILNPVDATIEDEGEDMVLDSPLSARHPTDPSHDRIGLNTHSHFGHTILHNPTPATYTTGERSSDSLAQRSHLPPSQAPTAMQSVVNPRSPVDIPVGPRSWLNAANRAVPRSTPSPTEPQAMRNLPKGPRSLLARTKELEERLTRSKFDMIRPIRQPSSPVPKPAPEPSLVSPLRSPADVESPSDSAAKLDMEQNLRRLVLQSRKGKGKTASVKTETLEISQAQPVTSNVAQGRSLLSINAEVFQPAAVSTPSIDFALGPPSPLIEPQNKATTVKDSMEDLAVSFITEAIQAAESPSSLRQPSTVKIDLAAKQKRLEEHITETKALMAKLTTAGTKSEKDAILKTLRERSKLMDDYLKTSNLTPDDPGGSSSHAQPTTSWPETSDHCILDLSDDEIEDG